MDIVFKSLLYTYLKEINRNKFDPRGVADDKIHAFKNKKKMFDIIITVVFLIFFIF